jgi:hypothetical protein
LQTGKGILNIQSKFMWRSLAPNGQIGLKKANKLAPLQICKWKKHIFRSIIANKYCFVLVGGSNLYIYSPKIEKFTILSFFVIFCSYILHPKVPCGLVPKIKPNFNNQSKKI